ncbi:MAG: ribosome maturation factor RimP [Elusimicrobiota bacterium]|jgi:ribosome maturation factor RimP|nr:ribosome maturation factor RimP [Elusimicrobiota bacterium]
MTEFEKKIESFLEEKAQNLGFEICNLEFVKENGARVLRIFIDKENGVNLDDCGKMGYEFGRYLDESGYMEDSYTLEVSSPGLNRVLRKEKDFKRFAGSLIRLQTLIPVENQRNFLGVLLSFENNVLKIDSAENGVKEIEFSNIKKANLEQSL